MILSGTDNRPPMLDKDLYDSWKIRMELYMKNREHQRMILESVEHGPLIWPTVEENGVIRTKKYAELSAAEKIQADCDMKANNIILQGLPADIYSLVNQHRVAKDLWERVQLMMQGTSLTKQERECKLYDAFDKFTHIKGESLHMYYLRFTQLINDMNIYKMKMEQFQVNTKFLNSLPPEWSKFIMDVKLVKDLHTSNFDKLHAYLEQHELHANEVRIMRERNQDPLAFIANQQMTPPHFNTYQSYYNNPQLQQQFSPSQHGSIQPNQHYSSHYPSKTQFNYSSIPPSHTFLVSNESSNLNCSISFVVPVFSPGDDPIACLNKAMAFLTAVASSRFPSTNDQLITSSNPRNQATIQDEKAMLAEAQEAGQILDEEQIVFLAYIGILADQAQTIIPRNAAFQTEDLDTYDSDCDDLLTAQAVLMTNISNYGSDIISEAQQDSMILSVIEQMSEQMINHVNNWEKANKEQKNESITAELERYKERRETSSKEQIDSLEQNLSKQIKEKESLFKTFLVFKNESKEKENKYMENEIDLEKKIKELDNIIYKVGQSAQTVHMLTKPQAFYDNTHKQALGYQNPFYLKKAQRLKPTLYDGVVLSNTHVAMPVIDDEETLILEEESRSKMSEKAKDPEVIAKKISHKPIDYEKLNSLTDDFEKRFSPQQELSAEQAFWFHILNPSIESSYTPPVIVEVPSELPKVSLVNASLKKLKFHLTQFDSVVKKRTTPNALEEGEWGFEHTKTVFNNEIIPFLKSLKDIFNVFDKDLLNEIMEVQIVFDQMDAVVQQSSVDKQCLEIALKENLFKMIDSYKNHVSRCSVNCDKFYEVFQNDESCVNHNCVEIQEYFEINDLKARLQDKNMTICKLKDTIKSLRENTKEENNHDKWEIEPIKKEHENNVANLLSENERKEIIENVVHTPSATTIAPGMFKLDLELLPPRLLQNREVHIDYLRNTHEQANILREIVEQAKAKQPLDSELDFACKYAIRIQELLVYVQDTCPNAIIPSAKKVTVKPMNNVKKVRFAEPLTSSSNIKQVESSNTSDSNTPVLSSTGVKCSTSNCGSKPPGNKKNDRISQTPSRNKKNKVEAQPRKVNRVVKPVCDVDVKHSLSKANSEILCATCNKSMFDGVHDKCLLDLVQNGNNHTKSAKKHRKQNVWKPTGHVFTEVGFK
ncbi:hypothetical protein Tco_1229194 [Tanacetum coccineum]